MKKKTKSKPRENKKLTIGSLKVTLLTPNEIETIYGGTQVNPPIVMMMMNP